MLWSIFDPLILPIKNQIRLEIFTVFNKWNDDIPSHSCCYYLDFMNDKKGDKLLILPYERKRQFLTYGKKLWHDKVRPDDERLWTPFIDKTNFKFVGNFVGLRTHYFCVTKDSTNCCYEGINLVISIKNAFTKNSSKLSSNNSKAATLTP